MEETIQEELEVRGQGFINNYYYRYFVFIFVMYTFSRYNLHSDVETHWLQPHIQQPAAADLYTNIYRAYHVECCSILAAASGYEC